MGVVSDDDIRWLISLLLSEGLAEVEVNEQDRGVLVRQFVALPSNLVSAAPPTDPRTSPDAADLVPISAPMAGVFYRSSAPDSPPFVQEGDDVQTGETVGLIEAMKLYNDIDAPCSGRVMSIVAADASRVAADEALMYIKPVGD